MTGNRSAQQRAGTKPETTELLASVAEQLKVPLTILACQIELGQLQKNPKLLDLPGMRAQTRVALALVDSYLLGLQLLAGQEQLDLEPVSVASTLTDTAHQLAEFAKQHDTTLEVQIAGRYEPVMANGIGLKAALLSLGYGLVEAQGAGRGGVRNRRVVLAVHRNARGIVTGLYGDHDAVGAADWRRALALCGHARQPFTGLTAGSGAGLFVADAIFRAMATHLRVGRHHKRTGLAATLLPSRQLRLV